MARKEIYEAYFKRCELLGIKTTSYDCPYCNESIKTRAGLEGDVGSYTSECPHCERLHLKVTKGAKAYGTIIAGSK